MIERDDHHSKSPEKAAPKDPDGIGGAYCRMDKVMAIREAIRRNEYDVDELLKLMLAGLRKDLES